MQKPRANGRARRIVLGILAAALCLLTARAFLLQDRCVEVAGVLVERASLFAWTFLILLAALSFGAALLRWLRLRPAGDGATALFGLGAGLAALSILTLGLGAAGFLGHMRAVLILLAFLALGLRDLGVLLRGMIGAVKRARAASWFRMALWAVLGFFLLLNLTRAFEPPWQYDALEYHLAAPAAYHDAGRVFFMRDNAYANFPQNVEMLDLLAMDLTGSPDRGAVVAQMLGAALGFFAALALRGMIAGVAGKETGDLAGALFYVWPGITVYSGTAYVELPLMFYAVLALWGLLWSRRRKLTRPGARGWVALAAIAAGAALGVKYTAALLVFAPAVVWLVVFGFASRLKIREVGTRIALFAGISILCFSPWLIRNFADTRNPVYPLLYRVFGSSNWDAQKDARWRQAHSPKDLSAGNFFAQAREALFVDSDEGTPKASLAVFLFVPLALLAGRRTRWIAAFLAADAALLLLLWFFFTQQNVRFAELTVPVLAGLSALGLGAVLPSRHSVGLRHVVLLLLLFEPARWVNYLHVERSLGCALGDVSTDEYFKTHAPQFAAGYYAGMQFLSDAKNLPPDSKILFLGEAQTFYCRRPYVASTVFDTNLVEEIARSSRTPEEILGGLKARRITHLYVDTAELRRLQESYLYIYEDKARLGMLDGFDWELFGRFADKYLRPVWTYPSAATAADVASFPWGRWLELLKKAESGGRMPNFIAIYELHRSER